MRISIRPVLFISFFIFTTSVSAETYRSDYLGQEKRAIKSLSESDIQQLRQGRGWGLAKAAELNGVPGPVHVLQMKEQIRLNTRQESRIQALYEQMKASAIPLGKKLISLERRLNDDFSTRKMNPQLLANQLDEIAKVSKDLRFTHLVAHLQTLEILTGDQLRLYNSLRGYDSVSPCDHIPAGHDAQMWKRHNGCQ